MADLLVITTVATTVTLATTCAAGMVADEPGAVAAAWEDGRDQVAAWWDALRLLAGRVGPGLVAVEVWVLELVLRPHGTHRRTGVA